jgi:YebC/PmpR family DNA-binding regulatory protein
MSGHSHSKKIKHDKAITDKKRGQIFSKLSQEISIAAKEGTDPNINAKLRLVLEKAKKWNMPGDNIERAVKRGGGGAESENLFEIAYEAYGPSGIAMIIASITDNKNRTLSEIKQILSQYGGKLAGEGSVKWLFEKKGMITTTVEDLQDKEKSAMAAIEAGADDIHWQENVLNIYTAPELLEEVKKNLEVKDIKIDSASLDWVAKETVPADEKTKEACQKLFDALDENDSVQEVYYNIDL